MCVRQVKAMSSFSKVSSILQPWSFSWELWAFCRSIPGISGGCLGLYKAFKNVSCMSVAWVWYLYGAPICWPALSKVATYWSPQKRSAFVFTFYNDWNHCMVTWKGNPTECSFSICSRLMRTGGLDWNKKIVLLMEKKIHSGIYLLKKKKFFQ